MGKKKEAQKSLTKEGAAESKLENISEEQKKKADDYSVKPDIDPGIDYMRWSD